MDFYIQREAIHSWIDILTGLGPFVVAAIVAWITGCQQKSREKQRLFEVYQARYLDRLEVYKAVAALLREAFQLGSKDVSAFMALRDKIAELTEIADRSKFLFDQPETVKFIDEFREAIITIAYSTPSAYDDTANLDLQSARELIIKLNNYRVLPSRFPELSQSFD